MRLIIKISKQQKKDLKQSAAIVREIVYHVRYTDKVKSNNNKKRALAAE
jgi:hypothetical protein